MQLQLYRHDGQEVRVVGTPEKPEWVARDVGAALGIVNVRTTLADFPDDEKGVHRMHTPGGPQEMTTLTESGLYRLIFVSHKPEAERFRKWVFAVVLPTIRKEGEYSMKKNPVKDLLNQARMMVAALEQLNHVETVAAQAVQIANRVSDEVQEVRVVGTPEAPEWVARDVGDILGIAHIHTTLAEFPADEKGVKIVNIPGGPQEMVTLTESGLYRLAGSALAAIPSVTSGMTAGRLEQ